MNRKLLTILFLIMFPSISGLYAQDMQEQLSNQLHAFEHEKDPVKRIDLLNEISYNYRRINPDSVMKYADMALAQSEKLNYAGGLAIANKNKGIAYYKLGKNPDSTIFYYQIAIEYADQIEDHYTQAACLNNIALIQIYKLSYSEAIKSLLKGVEIFDRHISEDSRLKALIMGNLGTAYHAQEESERAINYLERALAIAEKIGDRSIPAMYIDELASVKLKMGRVQEAYDDVFNVLSLTDELGDMESKSSFLITLADIKCQMLDFEGAKEYALEGLEIARSNNFTRKTIQALSVLSQSDAQTGRIADALVHSEEALTISRMAKMPLYEARILLLLSELSEQKQDQEQALRYLRAYNAVHESNRDQERQELAARLEANYQAKEKETQIELLRQQQLVQKDHIRLLWYVSVFFLLLLFIGTYVYYLKWRTSRALNLKNRELADAEKQLHEKNRELEVYIESNMQLENFAHLASHDLREPMRTIVSFSQLLDKRAAKKLNGEEREYLEFIQEGTRRIEKLINDLLTYAKINNSPTAIEEVDLRKVIYQIEHDLQHLIREEQAVIEVCESMPHTIHSDPARLYQVFQNLISNSIKYHRDDAPPRIKIHYRREGSYHRFSITDNGIGIAGQFFDRIFLLFKTLKNKSVSNSSGIGLATCKKIVEQMGGKIWLESEENVGSTFYFSLPVDPIRTGPSSGKKFFDTIAN